MTDRIRQTLLEKCNLKCPCHITLALSGGRDSVVLLHQLLSLREELGFTLSAVHIHHGLRAASDEEEQFVRRLCDKLALPLAVHHLQLGKHQGESLEMAARQARYRIFEEYIADGRYIATAHHLDDCMETFLINLCRGCGSQGLASIPYERDGIVRPMLDIPADDIALFAREHDLEWREDESNGDTYYLRNFIRREILPRLKSREDVSFVKGFETTLANLREESQLLSQLSETETQDVLTLAALPRPLLWRTLKKRCPALTRERFERIASRLPEGDFREQIEGTLYCIVRQGKLRFENIEPTTPLAKTPLVSDMTLAEKTVTIQEIHNQFTHFDIDCDTINSDLFIRTRKQGDRFAPRGMNGTKTVGRLFSEHHIADRDSRLLITDANDQVIFIEGFGADRYHAPTPNTNKALKIRIKLRPTNLTICGDPKTKERNNEIT